MPGTALYLRTFLFCVAGVGVCLFVLGVVCFGSCSVNICNIHSLQEKMKSASQHFQEVYIWPCCNYGVLSYSAAAALSHGPCYW